MANLLARHRQQVPEQVGDELSGDCQFEQVEMLAAGSSTVQTMQNMCHWFMLLAPCRSVHLVGRLQTF